MQRWEYLFINMREECEKVVKEQIKRKKTTVMTNKEAFIAYLNKIGQEGWEFCGVSGEDFLFKRPHGDKIEFHGNLFDDKQN